MGIAAGQSKRILQWEGISYNAAARACGSGGVGAGHERLQAAVMRLLDKLGCTVQPRNGGCPGDLVPLLGQLLARLP